MRHILIAAAAVIGVGAVAAYILWPRTIAPSTSLLPDDAAVVALGGEVYAAQCAACHGANLEGQANWRERGPDGMLPAPPHDETGHTWHHPDALLIALTKEGLPKEIGGKPYRSAMPAYQGTLSDAEIVAVLSHIKSRWPDEIRARHDRLNAQMAGR